jgi:CubicO group peptidase (beta-lactamase class C family)
MTNRMKPLTFVLAGVLLAVPVHAQETLTEVDKIFSWVTPDSPGCSVAATHDGKPVLNRAYGLADLERQVPITPSTVFDAGSVMKQFVAASVLLLVDDGRLKLTDDIRKYFPELPDYGHTVTVDHLLTHTSGVRDWTGILPFAADNPDALTVTLRQQGLNFVPGEEWAYSNGGYVLARELVARVSRMPFGEFARTRLFEPLGLKSTRFVTDMKGAGATLALAYEKRGDTWQPHMMEGNARGGGALLTTPGDLVTWLDALMAGRPGKFVTEKIQEPATLNNGKTLEYARGLINADNGVRIIWHGGSADAYKTVVGHFPDHKFSIAIMCNAGEAADARASFAARIFDLFLPGARRANTSAAAAPATAKPAEERAVPSTPAERYLPSADDLKAFAGRYESKEVGSVFRITAGEKSVTLILEHLPIRRLELSPVGPDTFQRGGMIVRFRRDDSGNVVALDWATPVNRNITFRRLPE